MSVFSIPFCVIALAAGATCLYIARRRWKWSRPGSGYKGITESYWVTLYALIIHGVLLLAFGIYCALH